ncbi:hypothetical protein [Salinispira pacifica]|uniref:Uncharacterized protein n=1 Tax=Salinispira pacifica TaxID=1307761 RepID=V5WGA9_9SPIO|nr:hypothetical protein [Salinispira pacifica]AHC14655.1 hypothetical protein L21SP2_1254 [Salinispira pacifica]
MLRQGRNSSPGTSHAVLIILALIHLLFASCSPESEILLILDPPLERQMTYELQQQQDQGISPFEGTRADPASLQKALAAFYRQNGYVLEVITISPEDAEEGSLELGFSQLESLASRPLDEYEALIVAPWQRRLGEEISRMDVHPRRIYLLGQISPEYSRMTGFYVVPDFGDPGLLNHIRQRRGESVLFYNPGYIESSMEAVERFSSGTAEAEGSSPDAPALLQALRAEVSPSDIFSTAELTATDLENRLKDAAGEEDQPETLYLLLSPGELDSVKIPMKSFGEVIAPLYQPDITIRGGFPFSFLQMASRIPSHLEAGDGVNIFISVPFFTYNK